MGQDQNLAQLEARLMPHNEPAEQALLGGVLLQNQLLEKVAEFLLPDHFYNPVHGRIYDAVLKITQRGQVASPVTLKLYFEQDESLVAVGGAAYLADLAASVVSLAAAPDYAKVIHDLYLRRQLIQIGDEVKTNATKHEIDVTANDQIEVAEKKLYDLATAGDITGGFQPFGRSVENALKTIETAFKSSSHITGVTSGLRDMDKKLGGLHPSDLLILAGRPSMGKTALATNIAYRSAKQHLATAGAEGAVVGFFSLEMSAEQLAGRILADVASVSGDSMRKGEIKRDDFIKLTEATAELARLPLYIDDTPGISIGALRTRSRRLQRQFGLGMIVVDYLQLMRGTASGGEQNRVQEISEITRGLKGVAKELGVPVIALSQLSRAVEQREDKRPQLADLRESGSIEQDADVVMFVFREEYYLSRAEPMRRPEEDDVKFNERHTRWTERAAEMHNKAEVIIAKQRHGPIGSVYLFFDGNYTRFDDLDEIHHPQGYGE